MKTLATFSLAALVGLATLFGGSAKGAGDLEISVDVDRQEMFEDESLQLVFQVKYQGQRSDFADLEIGVTAGDFEEVSQFDSPTFYQMSYVNGVTRSETQTRITKVLRPKKHGRLRLTGLFAKLDGKVYRANDLDVEVKPPEGARGVRPKGYGLGGPLSMSGKRGGRQPLLLRAEASKLRVVKGEQIIVSFYSYRRGQIGQLEATKLPDFKGFLKDDPELPVLKRPQPIGPTVLDGWTYDKDLLARYVVYPLETGTLTVDPLILRGMVYPDADSVFGNYFNILNPKRVEAKSDLLKIEVVDLPTAQQPKSFQGAVGDVVLQSKLDKPEVKVGEPVTLLVRLEGRANFASIEPPTVQWPEGLELFDSKSVGRSSQAGVGEKSFEYILIPRRPGKYALPAIEFSFFNPKLQRYESKRIQSHLLVAIGSAAASQEWQAQTGASNWNKSPQVVTGHSELRFLKLQPSQPSAIHGLVLWRWFLWIAAAGLVFFMAQVVWFNVGRLLAKAKDPAHRTNDAHEAVAIRELKNLARDLKKEAGYQQLTIAYNALEALVFDVIKNRTGIPARALPRDALAKQLPEDWPRIEKILQEADAVRFAKGADTRGESQDFQALQNTYQTLLAEALEWVATFRPKKDDKSNP